MLDIIKARKEELRKRGYKGFTLMEMLIVVAIIAILVAVAIPIFTSQLNRAKYETDVANARSYFAQCVAAKLSGEAKPDYTYGTQLDGDQVTCAEYGDDEVKVTLTVTNTSFESKSFSTKDGNQ